MAEGVQRWNGIEVKEILEHGQGEHIVLVERMEDESKDHLYCAIIVSMLLTHKFSGLKLFHSFPIHPIARNSSLLPLTVPIRHT